jgi:hypothetical protein
MLAADGNCPSTFGGGPAPSPALITEFNRIHPAAGQTAESALDGACRNLPIDLIGATDTDPAWSDRRSWVREPPRAFANAYVRLFRSGAAPGRGQPSAPLGRAFTLCSARNNPTAFKF